jgi:phosphoribosylformylglycinamidine cyclo-ligase
LPEDKAIAIDPTSWLVPPIFQWLARTGGVALPEMFDTFNMGIGFVLVVSASQQEEALQWFTSQGIEARAIGEVIAGDRRLTGIPKAS